jgi:peptidoglycan/LPS O-acetylase OafA/YrhL
MGALGMCLFFFLSSYLITELLQREKKTTGRVHLRAFYIRRALRIWPLYFGFIGLGIVIGRIQPSVAVPSGLIASFLLLAGNWYIGQFGMPSFPIGVLWSVSLEEQFYVVWPFLESVLDRKRMCVACLVLLPISSFTVWKLAASGADPGTKIWTNTLVQSQFFAMGALLSLWRNGRLPRLRMALRMLMIAGGLGLWIITVAGLGFQQTGTPAPIFAAGYLLVAFGCVLIVLGALGTPQKYLPKPIVYLGKTSYGLYVFHQLCLSMAVAAFAWLEGQNLFLRSHHALARPAKDLFALGLTIALASASYQFFEARFLRLKERFTFVPSRRI